MKYNGEEQLTISVYEFAKVSIPLPFYAYNNIIEIKEMNCGKYKENCDLRPQ